MKRFVSGLSKFSFFLFLFLFLLEMILRIAGYAYIGRRPEIYQTQNHTSASNAAAYVIMCIGDSFTFAGNVKPHESYPYQLWRLLSVKAKDKNIRVVNKGHCEYNSRQVLRELEGDLNEVKPQMVILLVGSSNRFNFIGSDFLTGTALAPRKDDRDNTIDKGNVPGTVIPQVKLSQTRPASNGTLVFLRDFFLNLRVYKMFRAIVLNVKQDLVFWYIRSTDFDRLVQLQKKNLVSEEEIRHIGETYFYQSKHELCVALALKMIESCPKDSKYYSRDLSYYYLLVWAFGFQDKYDAAYVLSYLERICAKRPDFRTNKVFMKYYWFFQDKKRASEYINQQTGEDIDQIIFACNKKNVRLVIQSYPFYYPMVNKILEEAATKHNLTFVDNYKIFSELLQKNNKDKFFAGDSHCTPEGYRIMAENVYVAISRER